MRLLLLALLLAATATADDRSVDFRYAPNGAFATICFPDDWQKTVVTDRGELGYDFGPGPYARPLTRVGIAVKGDSLRVIRQSFEDPRAGIATTEFEAAGGIVRSQAFALVREFEIPEDPAATAHLVRRLGGLTGTYDWASPPPPAHHAFRNVAWGVNRPVRYSVTVPRGSRWRVAMGLCEPYKAGPGMRILELRVEGADPLIVDPLESVERGQPVVHFIDGQDEDGDGALAVEAHAAMESPDPNVILNAFWLFPPGTDVSAEEVISGAAAGRASLSYDCGPEERFYVSEPRIDGIAATFEDDAATPLVVIATRRELAFDAERGIVTFHGHPHLVTRPAALAMEAADGGYRLELPAGTRQIEVAVLHGPDTEAAVGTIEPFEQELLRARWYWQHSSTVPRSTITVPDSGIQYLFETSTRTMYQVREVVNGHAQFQPGPSVYRGLWVHDALWHNDAALVLADTAAVVENLEQILRFQEADGRIRVMVPYPMNKETGALLFSAVQYGVWSGNTSWLRGIWPDLMRGVGWIRTARASTLADSGVLYAGLLPPSFADGGLSGVNAEYSGVYASLIGLSAMARAARHLGEQTDARRIDSLFQDLYESFRNAAARDARTDVFGNRYLPMMVGDTSAARPPQQAQWGICEAAFLGQFLKRDDSLLVGTLAMLESQKEQGLPLNTGWLSDGIWPFIAGFVGMAQIWQGDEDAAADLLYAYANHASPLGTWVEEQLPQRLGTRTTGDGSNASASSLFLSLLRRLLVQERGDTLELLAGIQPEWLRPGTELRLDRTLSSHGPVTLALRVAPDGKEATLRVEPVGSRGTAGGVAVIHRRFLDAGFRPAATDAALPLRTVIPFGTGLTLTFSR